MNKDKTMSVDGIDYERIPIKTHFIHVCEELDPIIEKYVLPVYKKGDFIAISEKFVTISQGRVIHISAVKPGLLAKFIVLGVRKYKNDIGYSSPYKMQVAIWQAGWFRMAFAVVIGSITRFFGRHGDFWRIAGNRVSEIDGFNPAAMPPFDKFAMLGPENPNAVCQHIEEKFGIPAIIIDGNNINTEILGMSKSVPVNKADARLILLDNPMGQSDQMTPIITVRRK